MPAVGGVGEFAPAILAERQIGRDGGRGPGAGGSARQDDKAGPGAAAGRLNRGRRSEVTAAIRAAGGASDAAGRQNRPASRPARGRGS